jgi:hypothetical protein
VIGLSACGAASQASAGTGTVALSSKGQVTTTEVPLPAGARPSKIATMVCAAKAQHEIAEVLGVSASVSRPTWVDHLYSCRYRYRRGSLALSVKELSSWSQTSAYFRALGSRLGDRGALGNLGQGAFATSGGSVVVRKDWKVLLVDVSGLPAELGKPPTASPEVAFTVADLILGCWNGD